MPKRVPANPLLDSDSLSDSTHPPAKITYPSTDDVRDDARWRKPSLQVCDTRIGLSSQLEPQQESDRIAIKHLISPGVIKEHGHQVPDFGACASRSRQAVKATRLALTFQLLSSGNALGSLQPGDRMPDIRLADGSRLFEHMRGPRATEIAATEKATDSDSS